MGQRCHGASLLTKGGHKSYFLTLAPWKIKSLFFSGKAKNHIFMSELDLVADPGTVLAPCREGCPAGGARADIARLGACPDLGALGQRCHGASLLTKGGSKVILFNTGTVESQNVIFHWESQKSHFYVRTRPGCRPWHRAGTVPGRVPGRGGHGPT